ncbi:MAG: TonB-dependent receptor [Pseudohongiellaceae bacterium]|nr:TonB-dependent receptor [Pseudohongiellaceae bacterium]
MRKNKLALAISALPMFGMSALSVAQTSDSAEPMMEEIVVTGSRASLTSALSKQRNSDKVLSVADSDALGNFPDTTAAEAMRRLSGISVENDQGEGRYVVVRGFGPELNSIYLNGSSVVAPEEGRAVLLDGLPTDLLDSIEVSKSLTPDQDADSIGGRVDFKTLSSLTLDRSLVRLKLDSTYNDLAESNSPKASVTWANKMTENTGFVLGFTYANKNVISQNNETGYGWELDDNGNYFMNDDFERRYYDLDRERVGLTLNFDYAPTEATTLYARTLFNRYTDDEVRYKGEFKTRDVIDVTATGASYARFDNDQETRDRIEVRKINAFSVGGDTRFDSGWFASYELAYSSAEQDDSDNVDVAFRNKYRSDTEAVGTVSWADRHKPVASLINGFGPLSDYELDEIEFEKSLVEDEEVTLQANVEKELSLLSMPSTVKFGFKYREREKDADFNVFLAQPDLTLADLRTTSPDHAFSNQFGRFLERDASRALEQYFATAEVDEEGTFAGDFVTNEDILAIYGMATMDFSDRLRVVAGLRVEQTDVDSSAMQLVNDVWTPVEKSKDYTFVSPSVNVKFAATDKLVYRAAYSRSLSRPSFNEFAPNAIIQTNGTDRSIEYGNFDLDHYESDNIDLSVEFYADMFSYISLGMFYKDIDNAIYKVASNNRTIDGVFYNDGIETWENLDSSSITGYEFNAQRQLNFLPGAMSNMYAGFNYTYNDAESTLPTGQKIPFRKMAENVANFTLGYQDDKWDIRIVSNYRDDYLDSLFDGDAAEADLTNDQIRFTDSHLQWDMTAKYTMTDNLQFNLEWININDEPEYYYWGNERNLSQYDEFGTSIVFGIRYSM